MTECEKILSTEFSPRFVDLMKKAMVTSYYKYGPLKENIDNIAYDQLANLKKRIEYFEETRNTEYLVDVANYAMMIFMHPAAFNAHYAQQDSDREHGILGMSVKELQDFKEDNQFE
jgi:hypothetical protein